MASRKELLSPNTRVVIEEDRVLKYYTEGSAERYYNEKYFYMFYSEFAPKLISYSDIERKLVIERCTPILEIEDNIQYRDELWDLLSRLHEAGANHRDVSLVNVVVSDKGEVLLIDWESATKNISDVSIDLHGHIAAGLTHHWDYGDNGIWWNEPWDECPGRYWDGT